MNYDEYKITKGNRMALWDELSRYIYFGVTALIIIPLKNKWDQWRKDNKELVTQVATLKVEVDKINDKLDNEDLKHQSLKSDFDKLEAKIDTNQIKLDLKNDKIFECLSNIDKATAINTAKLEKL